jgi:hypothetical protein
MNPIQGEAENHPVFQNRLERFSDYESGTYDPYTYKISSSIGRGHSQAMELLIEPYVPDPLVPTPGPGEYESKSSISVKSTPSS